MMIYEMAVADAYGIAFEFIDDPASHGLVNDLASYQMHPKYGPLGELKPSQFTDDTLRSIANAEVALVLDPFNPIHYVEGLQAIVGEDPRKGWSKRFQRYLETNLHSSPWDFIKGIPKRAESNGAIMGAAPLGYLADPVSVRMAATVQAITTHSATTAPYAQAIALAAHYFIYDLGSRWDLLDFLKEECEGDPLSGLHIWKKQAGHHYPVHIEQGPRKGHGPVSMRADETLWAVLDIVHRNVKLSDMLHDAVKLGGDTDSVAALAVAIGSCSKEIENDLPQALIDGLEEGDAAMHLKLRDLDTRLEVFAKR